LSPLALLAALSRHARLTLPLGLAVGILVQPLAAALRPSLPYLVVVLMTLTMIRVEPASVVAALRRPIVIALVLAWTLLAAPLLVAAATLSFGIDGELRLGLVLGAACPPITSAAALAIFLGLEAGLALALTVISTLALAATIPAVVALALTGVDGLAAEAILLRSAAIVFGAALVAALVRRATGAPRIARHAPSLDGVAVLLLFAFAVGVMDGIPALVAAEPARALAFIGGAFALKLALQAAAGLVFAPLGRRQAATIAFVGGLRNTGILLAILPPPIDPAIVLFVVAAQFPVYILPSLMWPLYRRLARRE
jgi:BASS family bile acid:Na+ symporter